MRVLQRVGSETSNIKSVYERDVVLPPIPCSHPMIVVLPPLVSLVLRLPSPGSLFGSAALLTLSRLRNRPSAGTEPSLSYTSMSTGVGGRSSTCSWPLG